MTALAPTLTVPSHPGPTNIPVTTHQLAGQPVSRPQTGFTPVPVLPAGPSLTFNAGPSHAAGATFSSFLGKQQHGRRTRRPPSKRMKTGAGMHQPGQFGSSYKDSSESESNNDNSDASDDSDDGSTGSGPSVALPLVSSSLGTAAGGLVFASTGVASFVPPGSVPGQVSLDLQCCGLSMCGYIEVCGRCISVKLMYSWIKAWLEGCSYQIISRSSVCVEILAWKQGCRKWSREMVLGNKNRNGNGKRAFGKKKRWKWYKQQKRCAGIRNHVNLL